MPLIHNGVTIPENVAGALIYNGVSLTQVIFNGVEVWKQSLFSAQWSGDSYVINGTDVLGINVSQNLFRFRSNQEYGVYLSVFSDGTFQIGESRAQLWSLKTTSNTIIPWAQYGGNQSTVYWDFSTKTFTGGGRINNDVYLETSGGLLRQIAGPHNAAGAWISLT